MEYPNQILTPNTFQSEALVELNKKMQQENSGIVVMPTGSGKTFLAALWYQQRLESNPSARLLYICHNRDILAQANEKEFKKDLDNAGISYGYYNSEEKIIGQVVFATPQTLNKNLNKFTEDFFDYIIIDEAHHYQAKTFKEVVEYFKPKFKLGLTATPSRLDGKDISDVCGDIIYDSRISDAIKKGILCKLNYWCVDNDIDFSKIKLNKNGRYAEKDLNKTLCIQEYDDAIFNEYKNNIEKHARKKTIAYCATMTHAFRMEDYFNRQGISAVSFTSKDREGHNLSKNERKKKLKDFREGKYNIIFVRDLFNEGIDIPDADCILMLRPTYSHTIFTQQIGRGLRIAYGKEYLLVLDFTGNAKKCEINFDVLKTMLDVDIKNEVKKLSLHNSEEKVIVTSLGCQVRLTKMQIDILNKNKRGHEHPSPSDLEKEYFNIKEKIKRYPYPKDMEEYSKYSMTCYRNAFGSWKKFLIYIGTDKYYKWNPPSMTKKELINKFMKIKHNLQDKIPTLKQLKQHGISEPQIRRHFGNYISFLEKVGYPHYMQLRSNDIYLNDYNTKKRELDRIPHYTDLTKNLNWHGFLREKYDGSYQKFLIGVGAKREIKKYKQKTILKKYYILKEKLGRIPFCSELYKECNIYGAYVTGLFGKPFSQVLIDLGEVNHKPILTDYKREYERIKKEIGRIPSYKDFNENSKLHSRHTMEKNIGMSWGKFVKECGDKPLIQHYTKEDLITNFLEIEKKLGKIPTSNQITNLSKICSGTYANHFGSYGNFLDYMKRKRYFKLWNKENIIKEFYAIKKKNDNRVSVNSCMSIMNPIKRLWGSWQKFLLDVREDEALFHLKKYNKETKEIIKNNLKKEYTDLAQKLGYPPSSKEMHKNGAHHWQIYARNFGSWQKFIDSMKMENIKIISKYTPKTRIVEEKIQYGTKEGFKRWKQGYVEKHDEKVEIRQKILNEIDEGDSILILESPELSAIKEIERLGKRPRRIIIPNNIEFKRLVEAFNGYKTDLNIELINTSVRQYLADTDENFNFIWLDYCGGFNSYKQDIDIIFQKKPPHKMILTYNIFDPGKKDTSYYFTTVIDYVLEKVGCSLPIRLIRDISYRYKKNMYNIGFMIG